jgi:hypothetical protein
VSCSNAGCADQSCDNPCVRDAGICLNLCHQHRRHRVDDRCDGARADDDDTGSGAVLFRHGGTSGLIEGNPRQFLVQLYGVLVTLAWSGGVTYLLVKLVSAFVPLRVSREHELEGLDISQHGEALQ